MVGVPRSRGCLLCVRRRVRCDEGHPGCAKCATYGVDCPGYDRSLKFVSGKHQVRRRGQSGRERAAAATERSDSTASSASVSPHSEGGNSGQSSGKGHGKGYAMGYRHGQSGIVVPMVVDLMTSAYANGEEFLSAATTIPPRLRDDRAAYVNTILEMVDMDRPPKEALFYGSWFRSVPARLGRKVTLDSAVCALAMHLLGKSRGNEVMVVQSRHLYGQSLEALQAALNHPVEWRSSETLCTTMVMCLFELFADTSGNSSGWLQHSSAVSSLMQHRGTDGFVEAWDRAMLFSFRSIIIMNALFTGRDCFLAEKKWQRLLKSKFEGVDLPLKDLLPADAVAVIDRHVAHLARLPRIMRNLWVIRETRQHGLPVDQAQVVMLRRDAASLHATFRAWYSEASQFLGDSVYTEVPSNMPADAPASPYATVLEYPNPWISSIYLSYVTSMLIIQESLNQCAGARYEMTVAQARAQAQAQTQTQPDTEASVARTTTTTTTAGGTAMSSPTEAPTVSPTTSSSVNVHSDTGSLFVPSASPLSPGGTDGDLSYSPKQLLPSSTDPCDALRLQDIDAPVSAARPFEACNRRLCRIIFRSFEKLGAGLMGQYRIGFAMRVAYEFADVPTQLWIRALLDRSVKTFASSRSDTYPLPKPNEFNYN
ncbi:uncharacterized protein SPSK_07234 [Sporothrix schenckii 1099-18]|uniref:Zn(2)-C6 fungal-type domain-containing protein n=1 Tax=Sporothrix schenckii 1099-18 TaxID=1397361 RepID=A0A0F2MFL8_SPOSC|nr:uncharacterized protein SPSK_07234 [Sporothrix schenckii 1099-18]KJR87879.1 hypothetical protein SPSK_07234 [Sporothrix schenckii 1099-18]